MHAMNVKIFCTYVIWSQVWELPDEHQKHSIFEILI